MEDYHYESKDEKYKFIHVSLEENEESMGLWYIDVYCTRKLQLK